MHGFARHRSVEDPVQDTVRQLTLEGFPQNLGNVSRGFLNGKYTEMLGYHADDHPVFEGGAGNFFILYYCKKHNDWRIGVHYDWGQDLICKCLAFAHTESGVDQIEKDTAFHGLQDGVKWHWIDGPVVASETTVSPDKVPDVNVTPKELDSLGDKCSRTSGAPAADDTVTKPDATTSTVTTTIPEPATETTTVTTPEPTLPSTVPSTLAPTPAPPPTTTINPNYFEPSPPPPASTTAAAMTATTPKGLSPGPKITTTLAATSGNSSPAPSSLPTSGSIGSGMPGFTVHVNVNVNVAFANRSHPPANYAVKVNGHNYTNASQSQTT